MALIEAQHLTVEFEGRRILEDVSLSINRGEIVTLIGPNGAGKSSLVRTMIGVVKPSAGSIRRSIGLKIGYVPQKLETATNMPITVMRFLNGTKMSSRKLNEVVAQYGIDSLLDRPLRNLSGGEMRRVLFAYALMDQPNLMILDEPTAGLDISATARFYEYVAELREQRDMAILLVSHDLNVVMRASDRVICINGHICCEGTPIDVQQASEYTHLMGVIDPVAIYEHHHDHAHES